MDLSKSIENLFSAKDLVVVITGGGSGIGLALAAALVKGKAAKVFLLGRRLQVLQDASSSIDASVIVPVQCDVTDRASIATAVQEIEKHTNSVDVLVNNAGIEGPNHHQIGECKDIRELQASMLSQWELWNTTWETNTAAVVAVTASLLHLLDNANTKRGWITGKRDVQKRRDDYQGDTSDERTSQIITVSSISGFNRQITAGLAYTASKAGATMLGKALSNLLAPYGIRSNVIAPGRFPSFMTEGGPDFYDVGQIPHGKHGEFEDLAGTILYLVGRAGAYVNGNVSVVDGGRLSVMPATY